MRPKGFKHSDETKRKMRESANGFKKGHITWNKGLSVDDPRVKKYGENGALTRRAKKIAGLSKPNWNKGHTKETDPRMALIAKKVSETKKGVPYAPGHVAWSKGLTKETDPRLSAMAEKVSLKLKGRRLTTLTLEARRRISKSRKGKRWSDRQRLKYTEALNSEDHKKKLPEISAKLAKLWEDPDYRARASTKTNMSEVAKKNWENPEYRRKHSERTSSEEFRKFQSEKFRKLWADDMWKSKTIRASRRASGVKPTRPEKMLGDTLNKCSPNSWEYFGDGRQGTVVGKLPDFVNKDRSKVIELFGDYWHKPEEEHRRRQHFKRHGVECLVIWERELENLEETVNKITSFGA